MRQLLACIFCLLFTTVAATPASRSATSPHRAGVQTGSLAALPLSFERNQGQTDPRVKFLSLGSRHTIFFTPDGAVLRLSAAGKADAALSMKLLGANPAPLIQGMDELPGKANYFIGNDPAAWRTNIATFAKVKYTDIYPAIDLLYYGNQRQLEFDFVVRPGGDPKAIRMNFEGAVSRLDPAGDLVLQAPGGQIRFHKPVIYQTTGDPGSRLRRLVDGHYALHGNAQVAFAVAGYDHARPLIIDPVLAYSTYLGGSSNDVASAIATGSSGNAYVAGVTTSTNFPVTTGVFQHTFGGSANCNSATDYQCGDVFVAKINATGSALLWATYLGGSDKESVNAIAVTSSNVFVAGRTNSTNFPTTAGAFQRTLKGTHNGFVTKLNSTGTGLAYSTLLGGSAKDEVGGLAIESSGNAYVGGNTTSTDFPKTTGAFQTTCKSCAVLAGFVAKLNATGSGLLYSSFLNGSTGSGVSHLAIDGSGNAYVTGLTVDTDFPTKNPIQPAFGGGGLSTCNVSGGPLICGDAFVTKFNSTGTALVYSTYLGGSGDDTGYGITVDASGNAYVNGGTNSINFPTTAGVIQPKFGGGSSSCATDANLACGDAFVTKINAAGSARVYSTYLGGASDDIAFGNPKVDSAGNLYLTGITYSTNFHTSANAPQLNFGGSGDTFVSVLNSNASAFLFSTYLGGIGLDGGSNLALGSPGTIYVAGGTASTNFPTTTGALDTTCGGCSTGNPDAFITKLSLPPGVSLTPTSLTFTAQALGTTSAAKVVTLKNTGTATLTITSITIAGTNAADFSQTHTCGASLAPSATCSINVTFKPAASGTRSASLSVADNASGSPQQVKLTGTGTTAKLAPTSLSFAAQALNTASAAKVVTLTNVGASTLTITSFTITGTNAADFSQTHTCGSSLAASASCTISVIFKPTASGTRTASLSVADNASGSPQNVALTGIGTTAKLSPLSLTFAAQTVGTTSAAKTVTLTNVGTTALTITSISITGTNAADFSQTHTCGSSLAAGASCTTSVKFKPTATGTRTASLSVADNASGSPQTVKLTGTGQ
jgi:hypothetical protein